MILVRPSVLVGLGFCFLSSLLHASTVAVIDSGIDIKHTELQDQIWLNPNESTADKMDNDNDGFVDDLHGWNFVNNNGQLIDYKYTKLYQPDLFRFFELQGQALKGEATPADIEWMKQRMSEKRFVKKLQTFGNFVHGTHVAGLVLSGHPEARILGIKLVPTENPLASVGQDIERAVREGKPMNWIVKEIIKVGLGLFAKTQGLVFGEVGKYIGAHRVDVANASLGMGATQARMLIKPLLKLAAKGQEPSDELVKEMVVFFLNRVNIEQETLFRNSPDTLFVFAAGNEGGNNAEYPTAPASIQHPHRLAVAAAFADGQLAKFSNYGSNVDVAALGVAVESTIPDNRQMFLSGTSQAAPYVAGIAAGIKDANPDLDGVAIKKIITGTVDPVASLKGKVAAGGVVNAKRALAAAVLSRDHSLADAIAEAKASVANALQPASATRESLWFDPMLAPR